jgi:hypothetical protein
MSSTFGPAFSEAIDGKPIRKQMETIRDWMLGHPFYCTLAEIATALNYPEASVSADLRHLRKKRFGAFRVLKRRREGQRTWEYIVREAITAPVQMNLMDVI